MPPPLVWALSYLNWLPPRRSLSIFPPSSCHHGYTSPQLSVTSLPPLPCSPYPSLTHSQLFYRVLLFFTLGPLRHSGTPGVLPDCIEGRPLMSSPLSLRPHRELQSPGETVYLSLNSHPAAAEMALRPHYSLRVLFTFFPCNNKR
ncbi:hypothetical protein HJG60_009134 [Phyllostomus discolor]|uniref:Uncharacterized protein n=1 Tax=Phyllostomus discolor TaxID=89673 RepID=A0A834DF18_9CHIR|nr:hypothetical protein HJG60_009134 [Phyllostomus discolor]